MDYNGNREELRMYIFGLAQEQKLIREMTRKYCEKEIELNPMLEGPSLFAKK